MFTKLILVVLSPQVAILQLAAQQTSSTWIANCSFETERKVLQPSDSQLTSSAQQQVGEGCRAEPARERGLQS
ncbi:hypothetical protein AMECASPLE_003519 [Ameca splendens]|uniref:Secreted protein n=1 Tax=Ameca splendens TaxID=208324 RepID=A0ABV1A687_9TELE